MAITTRLECISIHALILVGPFLLQNPEKNTKPGEHREILKRWLDLWKGGQFNELLAEGNVIQSRLAKGAASNFNNAPSPDSYFRER